MNLLNLLMFGACFGQQAATDATAEGTKQGTQWWVIVIYVVIFGAFIYFLMIRPQRKQKKQAEERMSSLEPGDSVLTTSGFYGTIVAINGDTVIVEFGNNKNCRIPMSRQAISQVEKANGAAVAQTETGQGEKKFFGHLLAPLLGFIICFAIFINSDPFCMKFGCGWMIVGVIWLLVITRFFTRPTPTLEL